MTFVSESIVCDYYFYFTLNSNAKSNYLTLTTKLGGCVQVRGDNGTTLKSGVG